MLLSISSVRKIVIKMSRTANISSLILQQTPPPLPKKKLTFPTRGKIQNLVITKKEKNTFKLKNFLSQRKN